MNKRYIKTLCAGLVLLSGSWAAMAQERATDTVSAEHKGVVRVDAATPDKRKTGWNFGVLPAVSFDSNLGFQYGLIFNPFFYGDGSQYPQYRDAYYFEASAYTGGSMVFRFNYDSHYLIPKIRTTLDAAYLTDEMMTLYGFNGYKAVYDAGRKTPGSDSYIGKEFYNYNRKLTRIMSTFQGDITNHLKWVSGFDFYNFELKNNRFTPDSVPNLFKLYSQYGGFPEDEINGGHHIFIKAGLMYDTRDFEPNPSEGFCTEVMLIGSPSIEGRSNSNLKLAITHRQFFPIIKQKLTFGYRVSYHGTLAGRTPWYLMQNIHVQQLRKTLSEGLGSSSTLRGPLRIRITGEGIVYANVELRWKFAFFRLLGQNWYLALNPFFDTGMVVQYYRANELQEMQRRIDQAGGPLLVDNARGESLHSSAGAGLKVVMNQNFIISGEWGKSFNKQDGTSAIYIGLNYVF